MPTMAITKPNEKLTRQTLPTSETAYTFTWTGDWVPVVAIRPSVESLMHNVSGQVAADGFPLDAGSNMTIRLPSNATATLYFKATTTVGSLDVWVL